MSNFGIIVLWVQKWMNIKMNSREEMARSFSDGVLIAKLLHKFHPDLINLKLFEEWEAPFIKKRNWIRLQKYVLSIIDVTLTEEDIGNLVNSDVNQIENIIWSIMAIVLKKNSNHVSIYTHSVKETNSHTHEESVGDMIHSDIYLDILN